LIKFMLLIGLTFVSLGPNYSKLLLDNLYQHTFSNTNAHVVLSWYFLYVAVIAINGITEAFVHAVASKDELKIFNFYLITFSVIYMVAATVFVRVLETSGLILANCINMGLRVAFSAFFIRNFFKTFAESKFSFESIWPKFPVLITFALSFVATSLSIELGLIRHILVGILSGISILAVIYFTDKQFCVNLWQLLRQRKAKSN